MGYPMHWKRLVARNGLGGDYVQRDKYSPSTPLAMIAGDMRRVEHDMQDDIFVPMFAAYAGITEEQIRKVLEAFFDIHIMTGVVPDGLYFELYQKAFPDRQIVP